MTTLDEIQARADAATEGPWVEFHENGGPGELEAFNCPPATGAFLIEYGADRDQQQRDANFIAHSREDVPKLVAALRAVEAVHQSDGHKSLIGPYCNHCISPIDGGPKLWPCPTIRAIQKALDG